ncbi:MAG: glycosyltransferase family 4 protein [Chitinophagaceae bacterium]
MGAEKKKLRVVYFTRKQRYLGNFSVETYFEKVRQNLPEEFIPVLCNMPYESNGILKRLANTVYCIFKQGDINHVTGDIHYVTAFLKKRKTVLTILDCGMLHETRGLKNKIFKFFWFTIPILKCKYITALSQATKGDLIKFTNCNPEKIYVVYACINDSFKKNYKPFNSSEPRILQLGTAANKNIQRLIPALKNIKCKLVIIGKLSQENRNLLNDNAVECEIYDRRLSEDEVINEYNKSDILAFVSTLEGFGMPIVEAHVIGRPVVTSNITSMPEVGGNAAHYVDPYSVDDINKGFLKVINDKNYRDELIEKGYANSARFSPFHIAKQYAALYCKIAGMQAHAHLTTLYEYQ